MSRTIFGIILLILAAVPAYFIVFCVIAVCRKVNTYPVSSVKHKMAVLIPARNEETVIGNLVQSFMKQDYPAEAREVYVLVNHCKDRTEEIAVANGAKVIHCENSYTKGEVLQVTFDQLQEDASIEAYVVMDADNLADPQFLSKMNDAFSAGYSLIQGRRTGKNVHSWISKCYEVFYIMQNIFFNHARCSTGESASFNGTAWLISRSYLRKHGYQTYTITEDIELMAIAAMQKERVGYVHEAVAYDEYPESLRVSARQLDRWIFGQVQCMRRYSGKLLSTFLKNHYEPCLDMGLIFTMPVIIVVFTIVFILWMCSVPAAASVVGRYFLRILLDLYLFMILMMSAAVLKNHSSWLELLPGILLFPIFVIIWLVLLPVNLFRRDMAWKPVEHNVCSKIEDMK